MDASLQNVLHHAAKWRELDAIGKRMAFDHEICLLSPDKNGRVPSEIAYTINPHLESIERRTGDTSMA